jgi:3D (Asp-Asp-Asp) domain-containing protein
VLDRAYRMNRRRLGILRCAAVIIGFGCVVHFTHRNCDQRTDLPLEARAAAYAPDFKPVASFKEPLPQKFQATAYCITGFMKAGLPVAPGYVSADPKVIPLGSVIYVETPFRSGIYQVMDTGELIKGKIIDIFIPSYEACKEFGRRIVHVKVLRYGFEDDPVGKRAAK